jgi:cytochrome P450
VSGSTGRARDRWVYLRSHPVLFALLAATRGRPVFRLGRTVLVHDASAYRTALTAVPLDRTATGTTGAAARRLAGSGTLFDQHGDEHRRARRKAADGLGAAGVERLRPIWTELLDRRLGRLESGDEVDLVHLAAEIAGATTVALLEVPVEPLELAAAAREAAAAAARAELPGPGHSTARAADAAERLHRLAGSPLNAMLAVAAVNTTVAALPRAAAWAADDELWDADPKALADELLRVIAPTPILPRVPAADAMLGEGCPVRRGDRMVLITRHAADAHRRDPDPDDPAPAWQAQLVFGAGPHACPGAGLARAQMADFLAALAPHRPRVVRARADRHAALPGWAVLTVRAATTARASNRRAN